MYEQNLKGFGCVRELRLSQGRRNESECRAIRSEINEIIPCAPRLLKLKREIAFRTEYDGKVFRARYLRTSTHFPGIVPELVNDSGDYMLITWLTFGSLVRLLNEVRRAETIEAFYFFR